MSNDSYEAYKLYLAVKLHFTSKSYDFFKHNAKVNSSFNSFIKRNDRFFFINSLQNTIKKNCLIIMSVISSTIQKLGLVTLYEQMVKLIIQSGRSLIKVLPYNFRSDCLLLNNNISTNSISFDDLFRVSKGQHPVLLRLLLSGQISIQTIIILDKILSFIKNWDKEIAETIIWPEKSFKIAKLKPFVNYNLTKCKFIMKEIFV